VAEVYHMICCSSHHLLAEVEQKQEYVASRGFQSIFSQANFNVISALRTSTVPYFSRTAFYRTWMIYYGSSNFLRHPHKFDEVVGSKKRGQELGWDKKDEI
jgi:hypothetical protein